MFGAMRKSALSIAVFASGGGTNLQALIDASKRGTLGGRIAAVLSNNSSAYALLRASYEVIPTYHVSSKQYPEPESIASRIREILKTHSIDMIVLAGYMKLLPPEIVREYRSRIINIHPALLPKYGGKGMYGLNVHKAVLESGDKISGATVHFVDEVYDRGAILIQRTVPVYSNDTPDILAARVLEIEHLILPQAVSMFI
jgi:phosphoribosylglycinamide formyltransferase 1